jgi:hypothetical protein
MSDSSLTSRRGPDSADLLHSRNNSSKYQGGTARRNNRVQLVQLEVLGNSASPTASSKTAHKAEFGNVDYTEIQ